MLTAGDLRTTMIPTPVKTAAYTAHHGDFVLVDTTSAAVTITLPLNPPQNSVVGAKQVATASGHVATIRAAGADSFNLQGGGTTLTLTLLNQGVLLQYTSGVWVVQSDDLPLAQLDARYLLTPALESYRAPAGATAETVPRYLGSAAIGIVSGTPSGCIITLPAGLLVSNLTFVTDSTPESGGTHGWYALTDTSLKVLAVSADQTGATTWSPGSTPVTLPVAGAGGAAFTTAYRGYYYVFACVVASSMPTFNGAPALRPASNNPAPVMCGSSGSAQTTPPAAGTTMTALTANAAFNLYAYTS